MYKNKCPSPSVPISVCANIPVHGDTHLLLDFQPSPRHTIHWHTWTNQPNAESRKRSRPALCRSIACNCKNTINIKIYYHITSWIFSKGNWYLKLSSSWRIPWNKRRTISKNKAMKIKTTHPQTCWSKSPYCRHQYQSSLKQDLQSPDIS